MKHIPTAEESVKEVTNELDLNGWEQNGYRLGYNKSQETHPFSDEDMIDFAIWRTITIIDEPLTPRGELELWKQNRIKTKVMNKEDKYNYYNNIQILIALGMILSPIILVLISLYFCK